MCIDFTNLNKACPKDNIPLPRIDKIIDSAAGYEVMPLLDCFSGYHQIYMKEEDKASKSFITPFGTYCFVRMLKGFKNAGSTCRCFGSDRTPGVAPRGVFRSRTVSPTVAKWFVPGARGTVDNVYRFEPLRDA
jgi:hypothetical protein